MGFIVTGASSGLGKKIKDWLESYGNEVFDFSLETGVDVTNEASVKKAFKNLPKHFHFHGLVNCAGINYINWLPKIQLKDWDRVMNTNARGIFLMTREALPHMERGGVVCNIISNASHVPMTHSAAYNASKGAAHILTLQLGRELFKTHDIYVFGVSPNKLEGTGMSKEIEKRVCKLRNWTPAKAKEYQLAALPSGQETQPWVAGKFVARLLNDPSFWPSLHCTVLPFGA